MGKRLGVIPQNAKLTPWPKDLTRMSNRHKTLEELCIGQQIGGGHILAQASVKGASEDKSIRA